MSHGLSGTHATPLGSALHESLLAVTPDDAEGDRAALAVSTRMAEADPGALENDNKMLRAECGELRDTLRKREQHILAVEEDLAETRNRLETFIEERSAVVASADSLRNRLGDAKQTIADNTRQLITVQEERVQARQDLNVAESARAAAEKKCATAAVAAFETAAADLFRDAAQSASRAMSDGMPTLVWMSVVLPAACAVAFWSAQTAAAVTAGT